MKRSATMFLLAAIVVCAAACTDGALQQSTAPLPTTAAVPTALALRPPLLIQFCDDDTGSYPRQYFHLAKQLMATSLEQAVTANQQGVTLYATAITGNTFDPSNTLYPAFSIPAIGSYPATPTPLPTADLSNPIEAGVTATAVYRQTSDGISGYNHTVATLNSQIAAERAHITRETQRLLGWDPKIDSTATSIYGCLQLAAERFNGQPGSKLLYIASDLVNNTELDYTTSLVKGHGLSGAIVHVIYFVNSSTVDEQAKIAQWCPYLKAAGTKAVMFADPGKSSALSDVFDVDLSPANSSC